MFDMNNNVSITSPHYEYKDIEIDNNEKTDTDDTDDADSDEVIDSSNDIDSNWDKGSNYEKNLFIVFEPSNVEWLY